MEFILPPTAEPFGPSCASCKLFADSKCLGVSTVRIVIGTALKIEEVASLGNKVDLSPLQNPAAAKSFRALEKALRGCPGPGNDGSGDFRYSEDGASGYRASSVIRVALTSLNI